VVGAVWLISTLLYLALHLTTGTSSADSFLIDLNMLEVSVFALLAYFVCATLLLTGLAIPIHRALLLGETPSFQQARQRFWDYFIAALKLFFALLFVSLVFQGAPIFMLESAYEPKGIPARLFWAHTLVGNVLSTWIILRLSMILPAVAIGERIDFQNSWQMTQGLALPILCAAAFEGALSWGSELIYTEQSALVDTFLVLLFMHLTIFMHVVILSVLFDRVCSHTT